MPPACSLYPLHQLASFPSLPDPTPKCCLLEASPMEPRLRPSEVSACSCRQCFPYRAATCPHVSLKTPRRSGSPTSFLVRHGWTKTPGPPNTCLVAGMQAWKRQERAPESPDSGMLPELPLCQPHNIRLKDCRSSCPFPCLPPSRALRLSSTRASFPPIHLPKQGCDRENVGDPPPAREPRHVQVAPPTSLVTSAGFTPLRQLLHLPGMRAPGGHGGCRGEGKQIYIQGSSTK